MRKIVRTVACFQVINVYFLYSQLWNDNVGINIFFQHTIFSIIHNMSSAIRKTCLSHLELIACLSVEYSFVIR